MTNDNGNNHDGKPTAPKPLPSTVGNSFVKQYYHLLGQNPETLHRFYKDESQYTHGVGSLKETPVSGQKNINDKILSMGFDGARVDLECGSVDCQHSSEDGVIVMVSGIISLVNAPARPFVQTFFLAVQPNGYFVLNDVFRYLDGLQMRVATPLPPPHANPPTITPPTPIAPLASAVSPKRTVPQNIKSSSPRKEVCLPNTTTASTSSTPCEEVPLPNSFPTTSASTTSSSHHTVKEKSFKNSTPKEQQPVPEKEKEKVPVSESAAPTKVETSTHKPVAQVVADKPVEKKNWASFLFPGPGSSTSGPSTGSSTTSSSASRKPIASQVAPVNEESVAAGAGPGAGAGGETTRDIRLPCLYVGEIPSSIKENDLRELFKPFGVIANISVHASRGFAFIDYEEAESVTNALADGRTFTLYDRELHVEARHAERKSGDAPSGGGGRGGRGGGRGGRSRGDRNNNNNPNRPDKAAREKDGRSTGPPGDRREKGVRRGGRSDFQGRGGRGPRVD